MLSWLLPQKLLPVGHSVPEWFLLDHGGRPVRLSDFSTRRGVVLVFFASDFLQGDLAVLQAYQAALPDFEQSDIQVLGISSLNWETLHALASRLGLSFPLLFDQCCRQSTFYQAAWVRKFITGRAVYGLSGDGRIVLARRQALPQCVLATFNG